MQSNKKSFKGQKIFVGIDVHAKTWAVETLTESGFTKRHAQEASAKVLFDFLSKNFPDGEYHAVYESGFSGFSTYYQLKEYGIHCVVVHAADVPSTQYEQVMKTDKIDAGKLARALRKGDIKPIYIRERENLDDRAVVRLRKTIQKQLSGYKTRVKYEQVMKTDKIDAGKLARALRKGDIKPIYIRERENLDDRAVVRLRKTIQKQLSGYKTRVKHLLHTNGVKLPARFDKPGTHWSRAFMNWLKDEVVLLSSTRLSLDLLVNQVESIRKNLLEATRAMRILAATDKYKANYELLLSIPGIGFNVAMCLLTEIYDFKRFGNENCFAHYLGLVPTCHDTGDKHSTGGKTFRGNKLLGPMIIEACWVAIHKDYGLSQAYCSYKQKMKPQLAIVKVARKMSNIIFSVIKNGKKYEPYKWEE